MNGRAAWDELQRIAKLAENSGRRVRDMVQLILTDVEMPEMDGYILTKLVKSDPRFEGIPVIMHSSLSGMSNQQLGRSVGLMNMFQNLNHSGSPRRCAAGSPARRSTLQCELPREERWNAPTTPFSMRLMAAPSWWAPTVWRSCCFHSVPARHSGSTYSR